MTAKNYILTIFAVWRLASLMVDERGPYDMFGKLRMWAGVKYDMHSRPYGETELAKLFSCVVCLSVSLSAAYVLAERLFHPYNKDRGLFSYFSTSLSISTGVTLLELFVRSILGVKG